MLLLHSARHQPAPSCTFRTHPEAHALAASSVTPPPTSAPLASEAGSCSGHRRVFSSIPGLRPWYLHIPPNVSRGQHRPQRRTTALGKTAEHVQRPASSDLWELRPSPWPTGPAGPRPPRVQHERPLFPLPPAVRVRALPTTRGGRQRGASGHAPGVHPTPPPLCCPLPDLASSLPRHKLSCFVSLFVDGFISFPAPQGRGLSLPSALVPQDPKQGRGVGNPGPQTSRGDGGFSRV